MNPKNMINGGTFDSLCGHIMCGSIDDPGMSKMFDNNMTEIFYNIQNMYIQRIQKRLFLENKKSKFQNTKYRIKILCDRLQL